jgi:hypothetical protein
MNINEVFKVALKSGESARLATEKKDVSEETRITISKPFSDELINVIFVNGGFTEK